MLKEILTLLFLGMCCSMLAIVIPRASGDPRRRLRPYEIYRGLVCGAISIPFFYYTLY